MEIEKNVAAHYTRGTLEEQILGILRGSGKSMDQLTVHDFSALDHFHLGGEESTEALAGFMDLQPGMHLLDVGSGMGGPARYFAAKGYQVTGIDLTEGFVRGAESLTHLLKLDAKARFRQGSALELPFESGTFDRAYMIHVGMNIEDKAGVFHEVARVLKPRGAFAIFDIMRERAGHVDVPLPWAATVETSFVAGIDEYRQLLQAAGFRIEHERNRHDFALEFATKMRERAAAGQAPVLGVHLLMGEQAPLMLKNVNRAIAEGVLAPVEMVARKN